MNDENERSSRLAYIQTYIPFIEELNEKTMNLTMLHSDGSLLVIL